MTPSPDLFQALSDPTRLRIVEALRGGELAVNDLVERFQLHQSGISRHLRILLGAGFVSVRPDGPRRLYSLSPDPFHALDAWMTAYRGLWEHRLDRFERALSARKARRARAERSPRS